MLRFSQALYNRRHYSSQCIFMTKESLSCKWPYFIALTNDWWQNVKCKYDNLHWYISIHLKCKHMPAWACHNNIYIPPLPSQCLYYMYLYSSMSKLKFVNILTLARGDWCLRLWLFYSVRMSRCHGTCDMVSTLSSVSLSVRC